MVTDSTPDGVAVETWCPRLDGLRRTSGGSGGASPALPPAAAAVIMTSSGTTGRPKIIPLSEARLLATAGQVAEHLELGPGEVGYSPLPLFHINGLVVGVLSSLVGGSSIVLERRFSRLAFWEVVDVRGVTWLNLVPAIIAALAEGGADVVGPERPELPASRIRLARSASAPARGGGATPFRVPALDPGHRDLRDDRGGQPDRRQPARRSARWISGTPFRCRGPDRRHAG